MPSIAQAQGLYDPTNDVLTHSPQDLSDPKDVFFVSFKCHGHNIVDYANSVLMVDGKPFKLTSIAPASLSFRATRVSYQRNDKDVISIVEQITPLDSFRTNYRIVLNVNDIDGPGTVMCFVPGS